LHHNGDWFVLPSLKNGWVPLNQMKNNIGLSGAVKYLQYLFDSLQNQRQQFWSNRVHFNKNGSTLIHVRESVEFGRHWSIILDGTTSTIIPQRIKRPSKRIEPRERIKHSEVPPKEIPIPSLEWIVP
jgi:hypothetical protein